MKRYLLLLCAVVAWMPYAEAQILQEGSLEVLRGETMVNFEADYSKASIMNMTEEEFATYEQDWEKDKPEIVSRISHGIEKSLDQKILFGRFPKADYTLRWEVLHINKKGDTISKVYVVNKQGDVCAVVADVRGDGGTFGSKLNLIKDGASESGEKFGKYLRKQLR